MHDTRGFVEDNENTSTFLAECLRLTGEVARTSGQLRLFAGVVEEGSWAMPRIDHADPARTPPKPDLRSMLHFTYSRRIPCPQMRSCGLESTGGEGEGHGLPRRVGNDRIGCCADAVDADRE